MVLVDSSVWITALTPGNTDAFRARIQLEELLENYMVSVCDAIRFDVFQKISADQRAEFLSYFNQLPLIPAKATTWNVAIQISWEMQAAGNHLSQSEAVVVALALQNQLPLFTYSPQQADVGRIRRLRVIS